MNKLQIRYNTQSKDDGDKWRLLIDKKEVCVSSVIINEVVTTTEDWIEDIRQKKWHITCYGKCSIYENKAIITTRDRMGEKIIVEKKRHLAKTISYRFISTAIGFIVMYLATGSLKFGAAFSVAELIYKPLQYYLHERFWFRYIKYGLKKTNPSK
jgi:uncharacterized membrane protein